MPDYLYCYMNFFGYIGEGTPEDPGTDFGMSVWIEAPSEQAALDWGQVLLADYVRARHRFEDPGQDIESASLEDAGRTIGARRVEGWIEKDETSLERAKGRYPRCRVGEIPTWTAPWRHSNGEDAERTL